MKSEEWRAKCTVALDRAGGLCDVPGCLRSPTACHHLSYDRLGEEDWRDLVAVCEECNLLLHDPAAAVEMLCVSAHSWNWVKADPCGCPFCTYLRKARTAKLALRRELVEALNRFLLERNEAVPGSRPAGLKREWEEGDLGDL